MSVDGRRPRRRGLVVSLLVAALVPAPEVAAETFSVDRFDDPDPPLVACTPEAPADCSLRGAVLRANSLVGADVIQIGPGIHVLTIAGNDDLALVGDLDLLDSVEIVGAGISSTLVRGQNGDRVFDLWFEPEIVFRALQIEKGETTDAGGGIRCVGGGLTLLQVRVSDNEAQYGGGIFTGDCAGLTAIDSEFVGNIAPFGGGGIFSQSPLRLERVNLSWNLSGSGTAGGGLFHVGGRADLRHCRFGNNVSDLGGGAALAGPGPPSNVSYSTFDGNGGVEGGGLWIGPGSFVFVERTEFSANFAGIGGGAIQIDGGSGQTTVVQIRNTTISGNDSPLGAGVRVRGGGDLEVGITFSTLAGQLGDGVGLRATQAAIGLRSNILTDPCQYLQGVTVSTNGGNVEALGDSCGLEPPGDAVDVTGAELGLGPLAYNGGFNRTRALSPDSVALGFGVVFSEQIDQRGAPRFADGLVEADSGAFELVPGYLFADGFENGATWVWDGATPIP